MNCLVEERPLEIVTAAWASGGAARSTPLHPAGIYVADRLMRMAVRLAFLRVRSTRRRWTTTAVHIASGWGCEAVSCLAEVLGWCIRRGYCDRARLTD